MTNLITINTGAYNVAHVDLTEDIGQSSPDRWIGEARVGSLSVFGTEAEIKGALDREFGDAGWKVVRSK